VLVPALHDLSSELRRRGEELEASGVTRVEEAAGVLFDWVGQLVDRETDLPIDADAQTAMHLLSDLQIYFHDLVRFQY
jgi:hypothetical protein